MASTPVFEVDGDDLTIDAGFVPTQYFIAPAGSDLPVVNAQGLTSEDVTEMQEAGIEVLDRGNTAVLDWIAVVSGENESASRSRRHARQARARKDPRQMSIDPFCCNMPPLSKENRISN